MTKRKPKAIVSVADGDGGMQEVKDHRVEDGDWPINFEISRRARTGGPLAAPSGSRMSPARLGLVGARATRARGEQRHNRRHRERQDSTRHRMGTKARPPNKGASTL